MHLKAFAIAVCFKNKVLIKAKLGASYKLPLQSSISYRKRAVTEKLVST